MNVKGSGNHLVDGAQAELDKKFDYTCDKCNKEISQQQSDFTYKEKGVSLCYECNPFFELCPNCKKLQFIDDILEGKCIDCLPEY